jgi:hypothetical protein
MDERRRLRRFLFAGVILGACLSIGISLLLDPLYSDSLGGTWRDAIVKDLETFLSLSVSKDSPLVTLIFLLILSILGLFGALMGLIFSLFVYKFFSVILRH